MHVKIRLLEESYILPALALGFDSQGKDGYLKDLDRYKIKSPGFYAVARQELHLPWFHEPPWRHQL